MGRQEAALIHLYYMDWNLTSISHIKQILADRGLRPKKRLGQNFLIDRNVLNRIVEAVEPGPGVDVLEIGPGLGVVAYEIAEAGSRLVCVEADRDFYPILTDILAVGRSTEIIIQDFLKVDLAEFFESRGGGKWAVVGNLPYYITSPIIIKLLESKQYIKHIVMMVQREVADRLRAKPGTNDYGALSVFVQYHCQVESVIKVSRNVFYPPPDVDSEVIKLTVREKPAVEVGEEKLFFGIVRASFGKRRKTILNALSSSELGWDKEYVHSILDVAGIDPLRRGETLSLEEFAKLANTAL